MTRLSRKDLGLPDPVKIVPVPVVPKIDLSPINARMQAIETTLADLHGVVAKIDTAMAGLNDETAKDVMPDLRDTIVTAINAIKMPEVAQPKPVEYEHVISKRAWYPDGPITMITSRPKKGST